MDVGDETAPPEDRARRLALTHALADFAQVLGEPRVAAEEAVDGRRRLGLRDAERLCEPERGLAVGEAVDDALGDTTHLGRDQFRCDAEDLAGRARVDVLPLRERVDQSRVLGEVREHAQLDLRIIAGEQHAAGIGDERASNLAPELGANRDVLHVRIARREAPGRGDRLIIRGVQATGLGIDRGGKRLDIRAHELGEHAVLEDLARDRVELRQLLEHVGVGREAGLRLARLGQRELLEQQLLELLRRADVDGVTGELVDLAFERLQAASDVGAEGAQVSNVQADAVELHDPEHARERNLEVAEQPVELFLDHARQQQVRQPQRRIGVLGGVVGRARDVDRVEADLLLAAAADLLVRDHRVAEVLLGQRVQAVALARRIEQVRGDHRIAAHAAHVDAVLAQDDPIVLVVLRNLWELGVLEQRAQALEHGRERELLGRAEVLVPDGNVAGLAVAPRERDADQRRAHGVERRGLGVERELAGDARGGHDLVKLRFGQDRPVARADHRLRGAELREEAREPELAKERLAGGTIERAGLERLGLDGEREIVPQAGQLARQAHDLEVREKRLAQLRALD